MRPIQLEPLDARRLLSVAATAAADEGDFNDQWKKAQDIISGAYFVQFGDTSPKDKRLTYDEQFAKNKKTIKDVNNDGQVNVDDLRTPDRAKTSAMAEAIKYMDHVDWYESGRENGAKAWINRDGTLAISGSGDMRVEMSGKTYVKYVEKGKELGRFALKSIKRIDVFGGSGNDTIRIGDTGKPVVVYARGGNDTVWGSNAADLIQGGDGDDQIHGGGGNDSIFGYNGNDRLWGDGGDDRIDGGSGVNKLSGGGSIDYITMRAKDKRDSDRSDKITLVK